MDDDLFGCRALLHEGKWYIDHSDDPSAGALRQWEPSGCQMLKYTEQDIHDCLEGQRVVFARDSTIRQIFWATSAKLGNPNARDAAVDPIAMGGKHKNLSFGARDVKLEFFWDPWLNSTALRNELAKFEPRPYWEDQELPAAKGSDSAALVVMGSPGLWSAHHGKEDSYSLFRFCVDHIMGDLMTPLEYSIKTPTTPDTTNDDSSSNMILLAPVQVPAYDMLSPERQATMTPEVIDLMNQYLSNKLPSENSHILWAYNKMTEHLEEAFDDSGLHVVANVAANQADIVLNARCNNPKVAGRDAHRGTCCTVYHRGQFETVFLNMAFVLSAITLCYKLLPSSARRLLRTPRVAVITGQLLFAVAWCQFSDRTTVFSKITRHYNQSIFLFLSICWLLCSLVSLSLTSLDGETPYSDGFLSRQQSDEIKGFMQALVLLYHYHHASQTLWVYKLVRVFMSGYFFLSAFGHSTYFLRKRDFSFGRVAVVLFRFNVLTALLPYAVNTEYNSYYFAPAITFWYLVVYLTHRVFYVHNQDQRRFYVKVFVAVVLSNVLISTPGLLECISKASYAMFRMSWDAKELRFRLGLDRCIVFVGIIAANLVQRTARFKAHHRQAGFSMATGGPYSEPPAVFDSVLRGIAEESQAWAKQKCIILLMCAAVFPSFFVFISTPFLPSKEAYNAVHPYISWVPILAFLGLRNAFSSARKRYLRLPAMLGRISLETYVLQYHMWLGNDATARLTTGLLDRYGSPLLIHGNGSDADGVWLSTYVGRPMETVILTAFFVAVAASTHRATEALAQWLFGPSISSSGGSRHRSHGGAGSAVAGGLPSSSSSSSSDATSLEAALGNVYELHDLGGGERRRQQGTSNSAEEVGENNGEGDIEEGQGGGGGNRSDNRGNAPLWRRRARTRIPVIFVSALSGGRHARRIWLMLNTGVVNIVEDPRVRAGALLIMLCTANWLYR
ncbi:hypothetical protein SLS62_006456 [Diatrype stigma]|uniref:Cas1p 10 TM acyl transferase domain-containing protein n=1 Tax=Diatrype stigma TaxID=117547 RepID=A0AAN9USS4_9PEZI